MTGWPEYVPLIAACPVLLYAGFEDLRKLRIANGLVLLLAAVFAVTAPFLSLSEIGMRLAASAAVFLLCTVLFCFRILAGGDVKLMAVAVLFVPTAAVTSFAWGFSGSMIFTVAAAVALRASPAAMRLPWATLHAPGKVPMGLAIALAVTLLPVLELTAA